MKHALSADGMKVVSADGEPIDVTAKELAGYLVQLNASAKPEDEAKEKVGE